MIDWWLLSRFVVCLSEFCALNPRKQKESFIFCFAKQKWLTTWKSKVFFFGIESLDDQQKKGYFFQKLACALSRFCRLKKKKKVKIRQNKTTEKFSMIIIWNFPTNKQQRNETSFFKKRKTGLKCRSFGKLSLMQNQKKMMTSYCCKYRKETHTHFLGTNKKWWWWMCQNSLKITGFHLAFRSFTRKNGRKKAFFLQSLKVSKFLSVKEKKHFRTEKKTNPKIDWWMN